MNKKGILLLLHFHTTTSFLLLQVFVNVCIVNMSTCLHQMFVKPNFRRSISNVNLRAINDENISFLIQQYLCSVIHVT